MKRLQEEVQFLFKMLDRSLGKLQTFYEEMLQNRCALTSYLERIQEKVEDLESRQ